MRPQSHTEDTHCNATYPTNPKIQHDVMEVQSRLQQHKQGHVCTRLMHSQTKEGKEERSKEGISRVKCKIFNPPSINQPCRAGNTACAVHLRRVGVETVNGGRGPFPSSSPRIQLSIFLNDVIAVSLSLHLHLHLLPRSILPLLSASRTHMLARPPICTYTCAALQYMMHPVGDGRIHINLEVPNCFEVSSKRMQPARLLRG